MEDVGTALYTAHDGSVSGRVCQCVWTMQCDVHCDGQYACYCLGQQVKYWSSEATGCDSVPDLVSPTSCQSARSPAVGTAEQLS